MCPSKTCILIHEGESLFVITDGISSLFSTSTKQDSSVESMKILLLQLCPGVNLSSQLKRRPLDVFSFLSSWDSLLKVGNSPDFSFSVLTSFLLVSFPTLYVVHAYCISPIFVVFDVVKFIVVRSCLSFNQ